VARKKKNYWKNYLPLGVASLNVFKEKKAQKSLLPTLRSSITCIVNSKLTKFNNIDGEREYVFYCWSVIVYVIPCTELKDFCARKQPGWI